MSATTDRLDRIEDQIEQLLELALGRQHYPIEGAVQFQICTENLRKNSVAVQTGGETDISKLLPTIILTDKNGSRKIRGVTLACGAKLHPYVRDGVYHVRVFADPDQIGEIIE